MRGPGTTPTATRAEVPGAVALGEFVEAFYCSRAFLPERLFLYLLGGGATLADARRLARGERAFAAWHVLARTERELLLEDWLGRTRSWLMAEPLADGGTRLCFGSGIMPRDGRELAARAENAAFRALLPGHAAYSWLLLGAAVNGLIKV